MSDFRQQQELEEERMTISLDILERMSNSGWDREAIYLAGELGLQAQYQQLFEKGNTTYVQIQSHGRREESHNPLVRVFERCGRWFRAVLRQGNREASQSW